ncbi:TDP-4-oxo-6-deoxy-D-glucose transaminase [Yersinia enterocolitica]|nr:TDP-4-oxo-6-deoxy-D-glucose transaminase [Yersinia enterocolitica]
MIPFNAPPVVGTELGYMQAAITSGKLCGDGGFTRRCQQWMEKHFDCPKVLLTPSCTASLEMAALLLDIKPGDEVIMPSFTFVSTANAFVLRGAKMVFVDIRPDTMNIDETKIEASTFVQTVEKRQGFKIACLEEISWRNGWLDDDSVRRAATALAKTGYGKYLLDLLHARSR